MDKEKTSQLQARLRELETLVSHKSAREEELERELDRLRSTESAAGQHKRNNTIGSHRLSDRTIVPGDWRDREQNGAPPPRQLETMHEADARSTATDSSTLWCEICETGGHDILTCTNMFANGGQPSQEQDSHISLATVNASADDKVPHPTSPPQPLQDSADLIPPLRSKPSSSTSPNLPSTATAQVPANSLPPSPPPSSKPPNPMDPGMVAGKASGVIDADKWCALCERDGHESVDCPFEDAF